MFSEFVIITFSPVSPKWVDAQNCHVRLFRSIIAQVQVHHLLYDDVFCLNSLRLCLNDMIWYDMCPKNVRLTSATRISYCRKSQEDEPWSYQWKAAKHRFPVSYKQSLSWWLPFYASHLVPHWCLSTADSCIEGKSLVSDVLSHTEFIFITNFTCFNSFTSPFFWSTK